MAFQIDQIAIFSVAVFQKYRGKGICSFIYEALDTFLQHGIPTSAGGIRFTSRIHIACSAPETMHLCQKHGYEKLAEVNFTKEKAFLERLSDAPFSEIVPRIGDEGVAKRMRGGDIRNEYYVKER